MPRATPLLTQQRVAARQPNSRHATSTARRARDITPHCTYYTTYTARHKRHPQEGQPNNIIESASPATAATPTATMAATATETTTSACAPLIRPATHGNDKCARAAARTLQERERRMRNTNCAYIHRHYNRSGATLEKDKHPLPNIHTNDDQLKGGSLFLGGSGRGKGVVNYTPHVGPQWVARAPPGRGNNYHTSFGLPERAVHYTPVRWPPKGVLDCPIPFRLAPAGAGT